MKNRLSMRSSVWWRAQACKKEGHHHTRDRRYCYWELHNQALEWKVRDRVTGRQVVCWSMREVRVWIKAARAFGAHPATTKQITETARQILRPPNQHHSSEYDLYEKPYGNLPKGYYSRKKK